MVDSDGTHRRVARILAPGSYTTTAGGVFLGLAAPMIAGLGVIVLVLGELTAGLILTVSGSGLTLLGHFLAAR